MVSPLELDVIEHVIKALSSVGKKFTALSETWFYK